jgi:hypothetical protein
MISLYNGYRVLARCFVFPVAIFILVVYNAYSGGKNIKQNDYNKIRNHWKCLKAKLIKEENELGSVTTRLKLRTMKIRNEKSIEGLQSCDTTFTNGI